MNKKMFAFGSLIVALIVAIFAVGLAFENFKDLALPNKDDPAAIGYGVVFTLISSALFITSLAGIVILIITMIKGKETKLPSILALVGVGIMIIAYDITCSVYYIQKIVYWFEAMGKTTSYDPYYGMCAFENAIYLMNAYLITGISAILAVLSLITFKKKAKTEPTQ